MIQDTELDAIEQERADGSKTEIVKQEQINEPVITFDKPTEEEKEDVEKKSSSNELIQKGVDAAIIHQLQTSDEVKERFLETGKKVVNTNLSTIENQVEADEKAAILKNNKDACDLYGIDEKTVPKWVVKCAKKVQDFWYAMWLLIGFFTTVPIVFLGKKIKVVIKKTWIAMVLAALIYIIAATAPLWSQLIK